MSNDSCLVMHPSSSEGIRDDMHDTTSESGSDISEASRSGRQALEHAPDVQSSCSPSSSPAAAFPLPKNCLSPNPKNCRSSSPRKVTDEGENRGPSEANDAQRQIDERRKRSSPGYSDETYHLETLRQPEEWDTEEDLKSPPQPEAWDTHDADFETSVISQRNRRVLMTRLYETAPMGRLSQVSTCSRLLHCYQYCRPRSYNLCFFLTLRSLISHVEESAWKMPSC
jgi:hypothetical protein